MTGWTAAGTSNPGRDNGTFDSDVSVFDGAYDFYGDIGAGGTLTQRVNLFSAGVTAAQINAGSATAAFSFFEQSEPGQADAAGVNLLFLNVAGTQIGTATSGEISQNGSWVQITNTAAIPAGTQYVDYQLFFNRHTGNNVDSFLDDVTLTVNVVPEPSTWAAVLAGTGFLALVLRRRTRLGSNQLSSASH